MGGPQYPEPSFVLDPLALALLPLLHPAPNPQTLQGGIPPAAAAAAAASPIQF